MRTFEAIYEVAKQRGEGDLTVGQEELETILNRTKTAILALPASDARRLFCEKPRIVGNPSARHVVNASDLVAVCAMAMAPKAATNTKTQTVQPVT